MEWPSESFVKPWAHMKIGEDKEVAFGGHHVTKPFKDDTSRFEEGVDR